MIVAILVALLIAICVYPYINRIISTSNNKKFLIKSKAADNKCLSINNSEYSFIDCVNSDPNQQFYYDIINSHIKNANTNKCLGFESKLAEYRNVYVDADQTCSQKYTLLPTESDDKISQTTFKIMPLNGEYMFYDNGLKVSNFRETGKRAPERSTKFELIEI